MANIDCAKKGEGLRAAYLATEITPHPSECTLKGSSPNEKGRGFRHGPLSLNWPSRELFRTCLPDRPDRLLAQKLLFQFFRHFLDILRRPSRDVHAEAQAHRGKDFLDLVE